MDFLQHLADDFVLFRAAVAGAAGDAPVPSCPDWTVGDLTEHVALVYLHKVETLRRGEMPGDWPPDLSGEAPLDVLDRAYGELAGELTARDPEAWAKTWHAPDQTVGFWMRRMAQETVIHRIDAEQALGGPGSAVGDELAVDGVDEVLRVCLYDMPVPAGWQGPVVVTAGGRNWTVDTHGSVMRAVDGVVDEPAATFSGSPEQVLRWLWGRGGTVETSGEAETFRQLLRESTQ
ncbi:maleylpyruvate isomerase family mycothiol-dependent enzyme [Nonomuraea sp. NPDC050556]|uniref:maleylpyruvate isomerase family mycothiol-dependent enzyme n=1 Tax=Nonomuraea sp. NPDC050556 TaxID=3364369 RepID=UPI0037AA3F8B